MRQQYIHVFIEGQKEEQTCKPASWVPATGPQNITKTQRQEGGLTRGQKG